MSSRIQSFATGGITLLLGVLSGCTDVNVALNPINMPIPERRSNETRSALAHLASGEKMGRAEDGWFVGLAISGGGSRSANFSAAVMFELQRLGLLDRVDVISSVSGGSLTAAYYCLAPDADWNPANLQKKLTHGFASDMLVDFFQPWYGAAMAFSDYTGPGPWAFMKCWEM